MRVRILIPICFASACAGPAPQPSAPAAPSATESARPIASTPPALPPPADSIAEPSAPEIVVIAKNQAGPTAIALDEKNVYWIDEGTGDEASGAVMALAKGSHDEPRVIAKAIAMPLGIAVGASGVFIADAGVQGSLTDPKPRGRVVALPFGKAAHTLVDAQWGPRGIALHGTDVLFTNFGVVEGQPSSVNKIAQKGGKATALAAKEFGPFAIAADDSGVYWLAQNTSCSGSSDGALRMISHKGGAPRDVARGLRCPEGLVLRSGFAYVTSTGDGRVVRIELSSGKTTEIATGEHMPRSIAVGDDRVAWIAFHDSSLRVSPLAGGKAVTLIEKGASGAVAIDASGVYASDTTSGTLSFVPTADRQKNK